MRLSGSGALQPADDGDSYPHWLFETTCASCHGSDARGLSGRPNVRCDVDVATPVRAGLPGGMPSFSTAQLDDPSVAAIVAWLSGQCAADAPAVMAADLYASNCARCHGAQAEGGHTSDGVIAPSVRCRDTDVILGEMAAGDDPMPAFPQLTAAQRDAIVGWVHGLCPSL
jgi:mono/diheme cytochrome c family protein